MEESYTYVCQALSQDFEDGCQKFAQANSLFNSIQEKLSELLIDNHRNVPQCPLLKAWCMEHCF